MLRPRALAVALAAALAAAPAAARTVQDDQVWLNLTVTGTLPHSRVAYFVEAQPRFGNDASRLSQLLLRPAIGLKLSDAVTVYGGYMHVVLPIAGAKDRNEERLFTQLSWTLPVRGLSSRTRFEHRRLSDGHETGWRLRELLRYAVPLGDAARVRALVSAEAFVAFNDTDWGARAGFDQLRSFAGVEVPLPGRSTIEAGYLNQTINAPAGRIRVNHVASLALFVRP